MVNGVKIFTILWTLRFAEGLNRQRMMGSNVQMNSKILSLSVNGDRFVDFTTLTSGIFPFKVLGATFLHNSPQILTSFMRNIFCKELFLFLLVQLTYSANLRLAHRLQMFAWKLLNLGMLCI